MQNAPVFEYKDVMGKDVKLKKEWYYQDTPYSGYYLVKLNGVFLRGIKGQIHGNMACSVHGPDGAVCDVKFGGVPFPPSFTIRSNGSSELVHGYAGQEISHFESTTISVKESGKKARDDNNGSYLSIVVGSPGSKKTVSKTNNIVPACASCDGFLFMDGKNLPREIKNIITDETRDMICPYCDKPLEVTWRDGKIIRGPIGLVNNPVPQRPGYDSIVMTWKGKQRPVHLSQDDYTCFMQQLCALHPLHVAGPMLLYIDVIPESNWINIMMLSRNKDAKGDVIAGAVDIMDPALIYPKNMFYQEGLSSTERQDANVTGLDKMDQQKKRKVAIKDQVFNLQDVINNNEVLDARHTLGDVFLRMDDTARGMNYARYYATPCVESGTGVSFKVTFPKDKGVPRDVSSLCFKAEGLDRLLKVIQQNEAKLFTEVKFFVLESTVQYQSGPMHYYLKPILNAPGKPTKIPKDSTPVKACGSCGAMLLRFSFDWVMQKDDLAEPACPYCHHAPLEVIERERRVVPVVLDFECKNCKITGPNNQIGVLYNGEPMKLTVKVQSMLHFIQNYQVNFPNGVMGPFNMFLGTRGAEVAVKNITAGKIYTQVDWRPIVLYPEDLIAF